MSKSSQLTVDRRAFMAALPLAGLPVGELSAAHEDLAELSVADTVRTYIKLIGSTESAVVYTWFSGHLWIIVPGSAPAPLVSFQGLAKSVWRAEPDLGAIQQSFDIGFFGDPDTGRIADEVVNPLTDETVRPYHFLYGGSLQRYSPEGLHKGDLIEPINPRWTSSGDQVWLDMIGSASAPNPIDPKQWPRESAGEQVHFGSTSTYVANAAELLDTRVSSASNTLFWTSVGSWEPWLQMGDAPGYVMWRGTGRKLSSESEIPPSMVDYISRVQPNYLRDEQPWSGTKSTWLDFMDERSPQG